MLLILSVVTTKREETDGKESWSVYLGMVQMSGIAKSTYNQKEVVGPFFFLAVILSYCLDNVQLDSVAVLDIAFQVMWIVRSLHDKW